MTQRTAEDFISKVNSHWSSDRLKKFTAGHKYLLLPTSAPLLLKTLGIMNNDATISADAMRKFIQVNHLIAQFRPFLEDLNERQKIVNILDAGCGSSVLSFVLAWCYENIWKHPSYMVGIDSNIKLIEKNIKNFNDLKIKGEMNFAQSAISDFDWKTFSKDEKGRLHAVIALHACDTATDDAISLGIREKADFIAVAPCCQAELASYWKKDGTAMKDHALTPLFHNPHLRREMAAHTTDMIRVLVLRGHGYEVTTTEFTMSHATPKNTLILAVRRGNYHKESQRELDEFLKWNGGFEISLNKKVPF